MFDFMFQLYNFVSLAYEDNQALDDPLTKVTSLQSYISQLRQPVWTNRKRKTRDTDDARNGSSKRSRKEGELVENDILSDVAILEALKRAGYTIPDEDSDFKLLLPVRVSFP
jgi:hypothetical protein